MLTPDKQEVRAAANQKPKSQSSDQWEGNDQNVMSFCPKFQIFATIIDDDGLMETAT